jgi:acetyl-CoA C-acetyltransferase
MEEIVLVSGARTAIGRMGGAFLNTSPSDLAAAVFKAAIGRAGVRPDQIDQVILGCAGQVMEDAYVGRNAAIKAGIPIEVPAYNVSRLCGTGLEAIHTAARWIETGDAEIVLAGGTENMTMLPFYVRRGRYGYRLGDATLEDGILSLLSDPFSKAHMGITAENLASKYGITRQQQDELSLRSHQNAVAATQAGRFREQIVPVEVKVGKEMRTITIDEGPRADTSMEVLAKLAPAFKEGGNVTAGNSSSINDGAAAVVVMSRRKADELGIRPKMRMVARAEAGVEPSLMGYGPIPATRKALQRAGLTVDDMDVLEVNEAFAAVACTCIQELGLDVTKTNPNGGAVALGHPVGATGAILTVKLMHELERTGGRYGLVTLCIGGGQGITCIFERVA